MNKLIIGSIVFFLFLAASVATFTQQTQPPASVTTPVYDALTAIVSMPMALWDRFLFQQEPVLR